MTAPTFGAPLVVNDDWTPYTNGDDFYADIDSYSLPCLMRTVGSKILAVYANTTPDANSRFGESAVVQARFLTVSHSTLALSRSAACDVMDYQTRNINGSFEWEGNDNSWLAITPVLGDDYAVITLRPLFDYAPTDRDVVDLVLLDLTGAAPVVVDTVSIDYTDLPNLSTPATGRAWDDVIILGVDVGGGNVTWRSYKVDATGFLGTADHTEAIANWASGVGLSDSGTVLAAVNVAGGFDGYRILTVDHSTLAITSGVIAPNGTSFTRATDEAGIIAVPGGLLTGGADKTFKLTTDGATVTLVDSATHPLPGGRTIWSHYNNGPSCGRALDADGKLWALYTTEDTDLALELCEDVLGAATDHSLAISTVTAGVLTDGHASWAPMCSLAFDAAGFGVMLISGTPGSNEAAQPYGKYVAVAFGTPVEPVPGAPLTVPAQAGSRFRATPVRATGPQGLTYLDTLGGTSPPVIRRELGGNSEAEWTWYAPATIDPTAAAIGNTVELLVSPGNTFRGLLNQPEPGTDGWAMHADGVDRQADRYVARADSAHDNVANHVDEAVDNAIADGLAWTRLDTLPTTKGLIQTGTVQLGELLDTVAVDNGYYWTVDDFGVVRMAAPPTEITYLLMVSNAPPPTVNEYVTSFVIAYLDDVSLNVETIVVTNSAAPPRFWNQQPLDLTDRGSMSAAHATAVGDGRLARQRPRANYTEPFVVTYGELLTPGGVAVDPATARPGCLVRPMILAPGRSSSLLMGLPADVLVGKCEWDGLALALSPVDLVDTSFRAVARKVLTGR